VKIKLILLAIACCILCCKKQQVSRVTCFKVKLIHSICNDIIFEIKDPNFYSLGQLNWTDALTGKVYNSVFEQKNNCEKIIVDGNNEAMVQISDDTNVFDCIFCLALYPGVLPNTKLSIKQCQ
jgi:hypothetical protein